MCRFTRLTYACGHTILLTAPNNTYLCATALNINLRQGIDRAPSACFPLPEDIFSASKICARNRDFGACEDCLVDYEVYTQSDASTVDDLRACIFHAGETGMKAAETWESRPDMQAKVLYLQHPWLRTTLFTPGVYKLETLYLTQLLEAWDWISHLQSCILQNAPRDMFETSVRFVERKVDAAEKKLRVFCEILAALHAWDLEEEDGRYQRRLSHLGDRLEHLVGEIELDNDEHEEDDSPIPNNSSISLSPLSSETTTKATELGAQSIFYALPTGTYQAYRPRPSPITHRPTAPLNALRIRNPRNLTIEIYTPPQSDTLPEIEVSYIPSNAPSHLLTPLRDLRLHSCEASNGYEGW